AANERDNFLRFGFGADDHRRGADPILPLRAIDEWPLVLIQPGILPILRDADDLRGRLIVAKFELLAYRVFSGPEPAREAFIDDGYAGRFIVVILGEIASAQEASIHRLEISGSDVAGQRPRGIGWLCRRLPFDGDPRAGDMEVNRDDIGDPGGLYAGQGAHSLQQAFLKLSTLSALVALQPQIERHFNRALRIEAEIYRLRLPQGA